MQLKNIPCAATAVDLEAWRSLPPQEWRFDDVTAWMIGVARKHGIPLEEMNMTRFSGYTGAHLSFMAKEEFINKDQSYGFLLYAELSMLMNQDSNVVDDVMQEYYRNECAKQANHYKLAGQLADTSPSTSSALALLVQRQLLQQPPSTSHVPPPPPPPVTSTTNIDMKPAPRIRKQHCKGNKLWEFIRDALKDPLTCPSTVRWEDPQQGVFRIVESEKLAKLWGDRKNNPKMTYEKLSRAMR